MKISDTVARLVFPHKAWPYPRGMREVRQMIVVTGILLFLTLIGIIIGIKYQEQKTLTKQDVKFAAQNLTSSASEMLLIARNSENQPLIQPYREVYFQQLVSSVDQVHQKLTEHDSEASVKRQTAALLSVSDHLSNLLADFEKDSTDETLSGDINQLHTLFDKAQNVEEAL